MKQQINLYKYLPSESGYRFTLRTVFYVYGFLGVFLIIKFFYSLWGLHQAHVVVDNRNQQLEAEQHELTKLTRQYPMINPKDLEGSVKDLKKQLTQRVQVAALMSQSDSFSAFLKKLTYTILPTVWLNEISIVNAEQQVILRGFSLQAIGIQLFLDNLNRKKAFDNAIIDLQNVTKIKNEKNNVFLSFEASNKTREAQ